MFHENTRGDNILISFERAVRKMNPSSLLYTFSGLETPSCEVGKPITQCLLKHCVARMGILAPMVICSIVLSCLPDLGRWSRETRKCV